MPTVWIPKAAGHDFKDAKIHGEIRIILDREISPFNIDLMTEILKDTVPFIQEEDFFLLAGPPIANILLMDMWPFITVKMLLFHARTREYLYREIFKSAISSTNQR